MPTINRKWSIASVVLLAVVFGYIMFYSFRAEPVLDGFTELNEEMRLALDGGSQHGAAKAVSSDQPKQASGGGPKGEQTSQAAKPNAGAPAVSPPDGAAAAAVPAGQQTAPPGQAAASSNTAKPGTPTSKIDINTATAEQLKLLPGIGDSKAKAIIAYRQTKGPFVKIEDIQNVKGVGPKIFENLKPYIAVSAS